MKKLSAQEIRSFVAGAFVLAGFKALLGIPSFFINSRDHIHIAWLVLAVGLSAGLQLVIGIGMFLRQWWALFWAQIYLWMLLLSACTVIPVWWYYSPAQAERMALRGVPEILAAVILLGLICWSGSERFRYEPDA